MHIPAYNTPRSAGLPVTRNMPYSSSSVPHRSRNLTGIYLGLEGNSKPPRSKSAIPPLARGRGMSASVRTPTEDRRYKMVEYLRIKEEKRGFTGGAVRKCKSANNNQNNNNSNTTTNNNPTEQSYQTIQDLPIDAKRRWGPGKRIDPSNIDDLIRPNPRNFTTVSNSGVTRSEKLAGWNPLIPDHYSLTPLDHVTPDVVEEVQKIASNNDELSGLEECYKRICKAEEEPVYWGNIETLYSLVPNRKSHHLRRDVGFTVRSYRNPAKAEILAEFPDPVNPNRPKTVPIQRPLVPSPFFFRHHYAPFSGQAIPATSTLMSPGTAASCIHPGRRQQAYGTQHGHYSSSNAHKFDDSDQLIVPRILAVPGAGGISRTLQYGHSPLLNSLQLLNGKEYMSHLPLSTRSAEAIESDVSHPDQPVAHPPSSPADLQQVLSAKAEGDNKQEEQGDTQQILAVAQGKEGAPENTSEGSPKDENLATDTESEVFNEPNENEKESEEAMASQVMIVGGDMGVSRPRPRLTTSNSGADIMLGLETDDGKSAEVEIDSLESDELKPEDEIPKGRVRKTSIVEKISKSKESELIALSVMENAGQRQREFEKLISEHQELVQEISRTPSAENIVQSESSRDP